MNQKQSRPPLETSYLKDLTKDNYVSRMSVIVLGLICVGLLFVLYAQVSQPTPFMVMETSGQTHKGIQGQLNNSAVEKQILYYARQFAKDHYDMNYLTISESRKDAYSIMNSYLRDQVKGDKYLKNQDIENVKNQKIKSEIDFKLTPFITTSNHPHYEVFFQLERSMKKRSYKPVYDVYAASIDLLYNETMMQDLSVPHNIQVVEFEEITVGSSTYKQKIEKLSN